MPKGQRAEAKKKLEEHLRILWEVDNEDEDEDEEDEEEEEDDDAIVLRSFSSMETGPQEEEEEEEDAVGVVMGNLGSFFS